MPETCLACGEAPGQSPEVLPICEQCEQEPLRRLAKRGFQIVFERRPETVSLWIHVTAPEEISSGVAAVLGPEKFRHKVVKLFKREMQLGVAAFDDAVYMHYVEEEDRVVFEDPTVQQIVRSLVETCTVELMENTVLLQVPGTMAAAEDRLAFLGGLLLLAADHVRKRAEGT